ncbi:hypothetical protein GCM10010468_28750 [Actinocorallia longicatena]|uniref:Peptidase M1 membrane alanine aminopeptidase domain-containing protein n=1 Tax=Actinocorallia longicatena TaxID=111803 RepID=A0ABP6Q822_9ACTN
MRAVHSSCGDVTAERFAALAQKVPGQDLTAFFRTWISSPGKPEIP